MVGVTGTENARHGSSARGHSHRASGSRKGSLGTARRHFIGKVAPPPICSGTGQSALSGFITISVSMVSPALVLGPWKL